MTRTDAPKMLFAGWDVGGWNCDYNPKSRDALVILDAERQTVGRPWRGNLRQLINQSSSTEQFVQRLLTLCGAEAVFQHPVQLLMGIDTPLGFSKPFIDLITHGRTVAMIGESQKNPYLHRQTEHFLFERGLAPLSPIKDMIGSPAPKSILWKDGYSCRQMACSCPRKNEYSTQALLIGARLAREAVSQILKWLGARLKCLSSSQTTQAPCRSEFIREKI